MVDSIINNITPREWSELRIQSSSDDLETMLKVKDTVIGGGAVLSSWLVEEHIADFSYCIPETFELAFQAQKKECLVPWRSRILRDQCVTSLPTV